VVLCRLVCGLTFLLFLSAGALEVNRQGKIACKAMICCREKPGRLLNAGTSQSMTTRCFGKG